MYIRDYYSSTDLVVSKSISKHSKAVDFHLYLADHVIIVVWALGLVNNFRSHNVYLMQLFISGCL